MCRWHWEKRTNKLLTQILLKFTTSLFSALISAESRLTEGRPSLFVLPQVMLSWIEKRRPLNSPAYSFNRLLRGTMLWTHEDTNAYTASINIQQIGQFLFWLLACKSYTHQYLWVCIAMSVCASESFKVKLGSSSAWRKTGREGKKKASLV